MIETDETARRAFELFARAETDGLLRSAYLLTGDRHHAEDLVQTVLAAVATRWHKVADPPAYARRVLYTRAVSWWRRRRSRVVETLTAELPERQAPVFPEPEVSVTLRPGNFPARRQRRAAEALPGDQLDADRPGRCPDGPRLVVSG